MMKLKTNQRNQILMIALLAALSLNTSWWSQSEEGQPQDMQSQDMASISIENPNNPCGNFESHYTEKEFSKYSCQNKDKFAQIRFDGKKSKDFKFKKGTKEINVQFTSRVASSTCRLNDGRTVVGFQIQANEFTKSKIEKFNSKTRKTFFVPLYKKGADKKCNTALNKEVVAESVDKILGSHFDKRKNHFKKELQELSAAKKKKTKNRYSSCANQDDDDDDDFNPILGELKSNAMSPIAAEIRCRNEIDQDVTGRRARLAAQKRIQERCLTVVRTAQDMVIQGKYDEASSLASACEDQILNNNISCELATFNGLKQALSTPHHMRNQTGYDFTGLRQQALFLDRSDIAGSTPGSRFESQRLRTFTGDYAVLASNTINSAHSQRTMKQRLSGESPKNCSRDSQQRIQALISKINSIATKEFKIAMKTPAVVDPNRYQRGLGLQQKVYCNPFLAQDRNQKNCGASQAHARLAQRNNIRTNRSLGSPAQYKTAVPQNSNRRAVRVLQ